jgi:hypothetical protein
LNCPFCSFDGGKGSACGYVLQLKKFRFHDPERVEWKVAEEAAFRHFPC